MCPGFLMSTMFKFLALNGMGNSPKRQQVIRACETCRKKKKACHHTLKTYQLQTPELYRETTAAFFQSTFPASLSNVAHETSSHQQTVQGRAQVAARVSTPPIQALKDCQEGRDGSTVDQEVPDTQTISRTGSCHHTLHNLEGQNSRFIGNLSPEGNFLTATNPDTSQGGSVRV